LIAVGVAAATYFLTADQYESNPDELFDVGPAVAVGGALLYGGIPAVLGGLGLLVNVGAEASSDRETSADKLEAASPSAESRPWGDCRPTDVDLHPARGSRHEELRSQARRAACEGRCTSALVLGSVLQRENPTYYQLVLLNDSAMQSCRSQAAR
jgi:hypothetical protein